MSTGREHGSASQHAAVRSASGIETAAERAPIWVIAIMAHVVLAAIFGMAYVRHDEARAAPGPVTTIASSEPRELIEDTTTITLPLPPDVGEDASVDPVVTDLARSPFDDEAALPAGLPHGVGAPEASSSPGRACLEGSTSIGPGGGPSGGGAPRGTLWGSNERVLRIGRQPQPQIHKQAPVVKGGLRWLREHQSDDGNWDCDGFQHKCDPRLGDECSGRGGADFDVGVTGLALLAFLGAGYDGRGQTLNDEAVRKGLKWLRNSQDVEGCFGPRVGPKFTYSHACATIAMCEAATFNRSLTWRKSAQAAIAFIEACRNPDRGWRYDIRPGESDASVTGWMLLALKAGKDAGLDVSEGAVREGLLFLDALTDHATGRTGYQARGDLPVRPEGYVDRWPARESEALTAVALCARIFLAREEASALDRAGADLLARKPPAWDEERGSIDMYYWYYGTMAMHQLGGPKWDEWNKALEKAVIDSQLRDGCAEGSWDPKDPWGSEGGRVYATALMTLCFEVYWRYPLVFGTRR